MFLKSDRRWFEDARLVVFGELNTVLKLSAAIGKFCPRAADNLTDEPIGKQKFSSKMLTRAYAQTIIARLLQNNLSGKV